LRAFFQKNLFQILFWLMYAVFTILESQGWIMKRGVGFSIPPLLIFFTLMALLMYGNNLFLIPQLLEKKRTTAYVTGIVIFIILYTYLRSLNQQYWDGKVWPDEPMTIQSYFKWNFLYAIWFLIISSMLFFTQKWVVQRQQVKNIQIDQLQTELKYLRAQINPHFLFNGLNTIYGSIDKQNQEARDILLQFADLLRYNLYEADVDWVELEKETIYLQNYVALQRARSDSNLQITLDISMEDRTVKVAPLIFLSFVENAFKFSTRDDNRTNTVTITLRQTGSRIDFTCSNSYDEQAPKTGGIGLSNVARRLELLYKDHYTLEIRQDQSIYSVHLILMT